MNVAYALTPAVWLSLFVSLFLLILSVYSWNRRSVPGALPFAVGSLLAALWAAGSAMEYAAVDETTKIFWFKFQSVLQLPATTAIACFVLEYVWPGRWLTRRNLVLLAVAPLLYLGLVLTNEGHQLVWRGFAIGDGVTPLLGPAAWVFLVYSYGLFFLELASLVWLYQRSPMHRTPIVIMLSGQIGSRLIYLLEITGALESSLPLDMLAIAFVFVMFAHALFAFPIFDPVTLARQSAFEQLDVGIIVLDRQWRVASLNPAAGRIVRVDEADALGRPISEVCPTFPEGQMPDSFGAEIDLTQEVDTVPRYCAVAISPLTDWHDEVVGRLLTLRDVTEKRLAQEQFLEQERTVAMLRERARLARELHDTLGQVCAFVNTQGQTIRRMLDRGEVEKADEFAARIVEVTYDADLEIRSMILGLCASPVEQGLLSTLQRYLTQYERNYGIQAELDLPDDFSDSVFDPEVEVQLLRILQEALTNVRKHSASRKVRISFETEGVNAKIVVQDFGKGFDLVQPSEEPTDRVGLRVMAERAEEIGGTIDLSAVPGSGTQITVRVPMSSLQQVESVLA